MNASEFQKSLSIRDVYSLVEFLGGNPQETNKSILNIETICHNKTGEGKHNLRYYADSNSFQCYSSCGTMSIYDLVGKVLELDFYNSFKYVLSFFNQSIYDMSYKQKSYEDDIDLSFFNREFKVESNKLKELNPKVLNVYYDQYYKGWIDEGISIKTMQKYNIKTSIIDEQIIIPHYDEDNRLVGVRCRNLNKQLVDDGKKYMPVFQGGDMLNHSTGSVLYGLNFNKEMINKRRKIILFESEKAVMQLDSYMPDMSIGVCLSGSSLTNKQIEIIKDLNVDEVIIAYDRDWEKLGDETEKYYARKIEETIVKKLSNQFHISAIWDLYGDLETKQSPTDAGRETFIKLLNNRIILN